METLTNLSANCMEPKPWRDNIQFAITWDHA